MKRKDLTGMKIRTTKYIIKEGILNSYRNKLMSLVSVIIVVASLLVFGIFLLFSLNLGYLVDKLKEQPEIEIFCRPELDNIQVATIEELIKTDAKVREYRVVSKKEAFEKAKQLLGDDKKVLDGEDESFMPISFIVKAKNLDESKSLAEKFKMINWIENVTYSQTEVDFINKISNWLRWGSGFLLAILLGISVLIISNTIKLTVFARRKEINIMKYIGATDWFIRWPFIIEGIIIGLVGATVAFILLGYGYNTLGVKALTTFFNIINNEISALSIHHFAGEVMLFYILIGAGIGAIGSFISIHKYLHV